MEIKVNKQLAPEKTVFFREIKCGEIFYNELAGLCMKVQPINRLAFEEAAVNIANGLEVNMSGSDKVIRVKVILEREPLPNEE